MKNSKYLKKISTGALSLAILSNLCFLNVSCENIVAQQIFDSDGRTPIETSRCLGDEHTNCRAIYVKYQPIVWVKLTHKIEVPENYFVVDSASPPNLLPGFFKDILGFNGSGEGEDVDKLDEKKIKSGLIEMLQDGQNPNTVDHFEYKVQRAKFKNGVQLGNSSINDLTLTGNGLNDTSESRRTEVREANKYFLYDGTTDENIDENIKDVSWAFQVDTDKGIGWFTITYLLGVCEKTVKGQALQEGESFKYRLNVTPDPYYDDKSEAQMK